MRLFIAITLSEKILIELAKIQTRFKQYGYVRFPIKDNLHLTLKFLGEVKEEKIKQALQTVTFAPFTIELSHIGTFNERILWAAFKDSKDLSKLKKDIDTALPAHRDDKSFKPHVTLARMARLTDKEGFRDALQRKVPGLPMDIAAFSLMQSELLPTGPVYTEIRRYLAQSIIT